MFQYIRRYAFRAEPHATFSRRKMSTIFALSTGFIKSAVAVFRISGPRASEDFVSDPVMFPVLNLFLYAVIKAL